jgi:uncharacterized protein (TIGR03382 family)
MRREFAPLFERYGVDLVLTGHDHNYERSHPMLGDGVAPPGKRGIPYLVVGGGGASLRSFATSAPAWSAVRNNKDFGFLDVTVSEGTLTAQLVTPTGKIADAFTLTKQLAPRQEPPSAPGETPATPETPAAPTPEPSPTTPAAPTTPATPTEPPSISDDGETSAAGCSTTPVGALLPLGALALAGLVRRRR